MKRIERASMLALALFATTAAACAVENDEDPLERAERSAQDQPTREENEGDTTTGEEANRGDGVPVVSGSSTNPHFNPYACPTWKCGFNGLTPSALREAARFRTASDAR